MSELKSNETDKYAVSMLYIIMVQERTHTLRSAVRAGVRSLREVMTISNSWFGKWRKATKDAWKGYIGLEGRSRIGDLEPVNIHKRVESSEFCCTWKIQM